VGTVAGSARRVVVKFHENSELGRAMDELFLDLDGMTIGEVSEQIGVQITEVLFAQLTAAAGAIPLRRIFNMFEPRRLSRLRELAQALEEPGYQTPDFMRFLSLDTATAASAKELAMLLRQWPAVEHAYIEGPPGQSPKVDPPMRKRTDDLSNLQGYLASAPTGLDIRYAWQHPGGFGEGTTFIDLEQGWDFDHIDLPPISEVLGHNSRFEDHGTKVLGVVLARHQDPPRGVLGIAPETNAPWVASEWQNQDDPLPNRPCAILRAINRLMEEAGDPASGRRDAVLLLETQVEDVEANLLRLLPVETEYAAYVAIRLGTALGVTIVEAAANSPNQSWPSVDLDTIYAWHDCRRHLRFGPFTRPDSRAILVGAVRHDPPHRRRRDCNFGRLTVDCYAWGLSVPTTIPGNAYTEEFNQTSAASAIIAGAALTLQGIARQHLGRFLRPLELRCLLKHPCLNTVVCEPTDPTDASPHPACDGTPAAGVMPNLRPIIDQLMTWSRCGIPPNEP
jgi:hypothetical protein